MYQELVNTHNNNTWTPKTTSWIDHRRKPNRIQHRFLRGVGDVFILYTIGFGLATLSYFTVGHEYIHAPAQYHFIIFFTFVIGALWAIGATVRCVMIKSTWRLYGIIFVNALATLILIVTIYAAVHDETEYVQEPKVEITTEVNLDTTTIYQDGNPVLLKVKDSIVLNLIDTSKLE